MKNYNELEKRFCTDIKNMSMEEVVELRDYYITQLDPKQPNKNPKAFTNFLSVEKYILEKYSILKEKFDNMLEEKDISKEEVLTILKDNNLNTNLFFINDILSLIKLINLLEVQYV